MENDMSGSASRSIHHLAQHGERASSVIIHDAPRPVGTEIGYEHLGAPREGYNLVWMRALLAGSVGAGTIQLQHCARWCIGVIIIEVWGRAGQRGSQDRPGIVLYFGTQQGSASSTETRSAKGCRTCAGSSTHIPDEKGLHRRKQRTGDSTTAWDFSDYGAVACLIECERDDDAILLFQASECQKRIGWMSNGRHRVGPDNYL